MVAVAADNGASTWFRNWLYPAGQKEVKFQLQAANGWVCFDPDPNSGFNIRFVPRPVNSSGYWLRGPMDPRSCVRDVKIARALLGHRFWMVSTWRVHLYRAILFASIMTIAHNLGWASLYLGGILAYALVSIPSPCTPRGLVLWCESMGFQENRLARNRGMDEIEAEKFVEMIAEDGHD